MIARSLFVETHAHLDDPQFDEDRDAVIDAAAAVGVNTIINVGYNPDRWTSTLALAERRSEIRYTLGLHPLHANEGSEAVMARLETLVVEKRPVAIGEIGIDLLRKQDDLGAQVHYFEHQIDMAVRQDLPIVVHQRQAANEVASVLRSSPTSLRVLLHSFDGASILADLANERGWSLGVGGLMTRKQAEILRTHLATVDLGRVVLETDAPYLIPSGVTSRRNTPSAIPIIATRLGEITDRGMDEIAAITTANACSFFKIRPEPAA